MTTSRFSGHRGTKSALKTFRMRTLAIVLGILALIALVAILIAPDLELDDYCDEPFYRLVVVLLFSLLHLFCFRDCLRLLDIDLRSRPPQVPLDLWLRISQATAAPLPLLC